MIRDASPPAASHTDRDRLGDFTTDTRLLALTQMAAVVGGPWWIRRVRRWGW
jgi:hypothetical protein